MERSKVFGMRGSGVVALAAAAAVALAAPPAHAQVRCGDVVAAGTQAVLAGDLACDGADEAVRVEADAVLDLGGFAVRCTDADGDGRTPARGIVLTGRGATVRNGRVAGCGHNVVLAGEGRHAVAGLTAASGAAGVVARSDRNVIADSVAFGNGQHGFLVVGTANRLTGNVARDNGAVGFFVTRRTALTGNVASGHQQAGFLVASDRSTLLANRAVEGAVGFYVRGASNRLERNVGEANITGVLLDEGSRGNVLERNVMRANLFTGFFVPGGAGNRLHRNRAEDNGSHGVILFATASRTVVHGTIARSNGGSDLSDEAQACGSSRWRDNDFGTSNQACIE